MDAYDNDEDESLQFLSYQLEIEHKRSIEEKIECLERRNEKNQN